MSAPKTSPWKTVEVQATSFNDVMSEELARKFQDDEEKKFKATNSVRADALSTTPEMKVTLEAWSEHDESPTNHEDQTDSDLLLAKMLQAQYDKEHDRQLQKEEQKFNGSSKVSISFANYRTYGSNVEDVDDDDSSDEEDIEGFDKNNKKLNWDTFEEREKHTPSMGKCGYSKQGKQITTKHDAEICGRKNACRVMQFPPGFETGDGGGFDMCLSNSVFNSLKVHSINEEKRTKRVHDKEEKATAMQAFDSKTRLLLYKLVNNGVLESVNGTVNVGKEAVVLHAVGGRFEDDPERVVPPDCAVKVFRTTLNEFKNRDRYIKDDYRFKDKFSKQNPRKFISLWAEKEMHNLNRLYKAGLSCPRVVILKKHILVMAFLGKDTQPAPMLKEALLNRDQLKTAYNQTVKIMSDMFNLCRLVHADLSEYNLLWFNDRVWVIDVAQSVEPTHPNALEFLYSDCSNVSNFFNKRGVDNVMTPKELFTLVSGVDLPGEGAELLTQIRDYEKSDLVLSNEASEKQYPFNYVFDEVSRKQRRRTRSSGSERNRSAAEEDEADD